MSQDLNVILTAMTLYAAIVVSPGPDFVVISRLSVSGSRLAALGAALGFGLGATVYAVLTIAGLSLLLQRIGWFANLVQIAGGLYLVYLGISAWRIRTASAEAAWQEKPCGFWYGLRTGLLVKLSNAKAIAFFLGFYAVAVPADTALWAKLFILGGGFSIELFWYGIVALVLSTQHARNVYRRFGLWIERAMGGLLAGFGLRLIAEKV